MRVIAIEEAFSNKFVSENYSPEWQASIEKMTQGKLYDVGPRRIERMDQAGIDFQVLSLSSPGVQTFDLEKAEDLAKRSNDWLAGMVAEFPSRFGAFAALPTQDGRKAADELEARVTKDKFLGALINGHTHGKLMDDPSLWPIYERAEALDVPIYLHPANAPKPILDTYYKDHPELVGAAWGWAVDVATQTLRMMVSGVFDRYPKLKFVVGHMGELIPFHLSRIEKAVGMQKKIPRTIGEYMRENVWITTSGVFEHSALMCSVSTLGIDRILFSVDDPFASNQEAMRFLETVPLSDPDKHKLAHANAEKIMAIPRAHTEENKK